MKKIYSIILLFCVLLSLDACKNDSDKQEAGIVKQDSISTDASKVLNDIRFEGWTVEEWCDNDYIRTLRNYVDAYNRGEIEDSTLIPYKELLKGQFVVETIEAFLLGGVYMNITFIDDPEKVFIAWVYSEVDTDTEEVGPYECRDFRFEDGLIGCTKEELRKIMAEHPEMKIW